MEIREIDTLRALRRVFAAPEEHRWDVFKQEIMEPIRPVWERSMQYAGQRPTTGDPAMAAARTMKLYTPDMGAD